MSTKKYDSSVEPDPCPNLVIERGPSNKGVGSWVPAQKHRLLWEYLYATRNAWKKWPSHVFIDPFAGPGRIQVEGEKGTRDGGAVVAWRALSDTAPFSQMLVGDIDSDRAYACAERLRKIGAPVTHFVGPADQTIKEMVASVPPRSLCMAYIDPYNLELLSFSLIESLAKIKVDLAINFRPWTCNAMQNWNSIQSARGSMELHQVGVRSRKFSTRANKACLWLSSTIGAAVSVL
jgi:three-Cys-motif partner protein